jgi:RNA-directed DNA polymerase
VVSLAELTAKFRSVWPFLNERTRRLMACAWWGAYFRTGNAAIKFGQVDDYVAWRLKRLLLRRHGRHLRPGQAARWTPDFFHALGLYRLRGSIQYPEAA